MLKFLKKTFPLTTIDFKLFFLFASIIIGFIFIGESALNNPGYGPDATIYASWVRNCPDFIHQTVNPYHFQKTFPSIGVNLFMRVLKLDLTEENIKFTFKLFSHGALVLSILFFLLIFNEIKYNKFQKIVGLSTLIFTKLILLLPTWNAVSVDSTAILLSTIIIWAYLKNNLLFLTTAGFIAAFTWPSLLIFSSFLFVFPPPSKLKKPSKLFPDSIYKGITFICKSTPIIASTSIVLLTAYLYYTGEYINWAKPANMLDYTPVLDNFSIILSFFIMGAFIFFIFKHALNPVLVVNYLKTVNYKQMLFRGILFLVLFIFVKLIISKFAAPIPPVVSFERIISTTLIFGISYPGTFITNHIIYYGPIVIFILYYYKDVVTLLIEKSGLGLIASILIGAIFGLNSETRYFFNVIHILLIFTIPILSFKLKTLTIKSIIPMHIAYSLIWIPLLYNLTQDDVFLTKTHTVNGPWMSHSQLLFYNLIILTTTFILIFINKKAKTKL